MKPILLNAEPITPRPFLGLGVEADSFVFDETNRACGVNEEDLELIARRVRCLRPSLARIFVDTSWLAHLESADESIEASPEYLALIRQLTLLKEAGTLVNLVLFGPGPWEKSELESDVRLMVRGVAHLRGKENFGHIRWLTLWNEPDQTFSHGSELGTRLFGEGAPSTWEEYVRLNHVAYQLLHEDPRLKEVKLVVADTVWGPMMRRERMELAFAAFKDLDVAYSYHTYSHEDEIRNQANPDYFYLGMQEEAARFRKLLGPDRELVCWEFNTSGVTGFGTFFAGIGPSGEDRISSVLGATELVNKVLSGMSGGLDGLALWCLHDMIYGGPKDPRLMEFGLWRFKRQNWFPRPIYHYYAALVGAFRPGVRIHQVEHDLPDLKAVAAKDGKGALVALLNLATIYQEVPVSFPADATLIRVAPTRLPATADLPLHVGREPERLGQVAQLNLEPCELVLVFWGGYSFGNG